MATKKTTQTDSKKTPAAKSGSKPAAKKKSTNAAKPSAKKKTTSAKAPQSSNAVKKQEPVSNSLKAVKAKENRRFWSYILFCIGVFELFVTFVRGDGLWENMYNLNRGIFGITVFLFAPMIIYVALMIASDYAHNTVLAKVIEGTVLMLLLSGIAQIIQVGAVEGSSFLKKISGLYADGVNLRGGGVASAILGWPLLAAFKQVGACIIIILVAFTFVMLLTDITLPQLLRAITKPFKKGYEAVNEDRIIRAERAESKSENSEEKLGKSKIRHARKDTEVDFAKYIPDDGTSVAAEEFLPVNSDGDVEEENFDIDFKPLPQHPVISPKITPQKLEEAAKTTENTELKRIINQAISRTETDDEEKKPEVVNVEHNGQTTFFEKDDKISAYVYPPVDILKFSKNVTPQEVVQKEISDKSEKLVNTLETYAAKSRITDIYHGPSVTRYELEPAAGVRVNKITGLADDIALNLAAMSVRIEAPVPGKPCIGVEVPNEHRDTVSLRELIDSDEYRAAKGKLTFAVGKDIEGHIVIGDVAKMPHLLVAGTTGSGKSVFTNSIILSILYHASPDEVKLILIDPKKVEFPIYHNIPHLLSPVVTEPLKAAGALGWALNETLKRYNRLEANHVKNIEEYNNLVKREREKPEGERNDEIANLDTLPQIVIVIDEFADLMMAAKSEVEDTVCRIAQIARAAGIHMIIATQSPRKDVITGLIKSNIPSRVALSVSSIMDSRVIFDYGGAEKLLGNGDLLYKPVGVKTPIRIQSGFASTKEINAVCDFLRSEQPSQYSEEVLNGIEENTPQPKANPDTTDKGSDSTFAFNPDDEFIDQAISLIVHTGQASTSNLQRKLKLGFSRASRIMDEIEERGIIGPQEGSKPRQVLITEQEWLEMKARR